MSNDSNPSLEHAFTVDEIAAAWRKRPRFVRGEIHAGRLRAYRVGIELRVFQKDLDDYLRRNVSRGPASCRIREDRR